MRNWKKWVLAATLVLLMAALSGCTGATAEELYTPPQLSERYLRLQRAIDGLLNSGAQYAPPASGSHRQAMQLEDLDGDGAGEVIAFMNFLGSDKPLRLYIFRQTEDGYEEAARIEGEGAGIDRVSYTDMDGDGIKEIAVGWQIAPGLNLLSVYTIKEYQVSQVFSTDYTEYIVSPLNRNTHSDVVALRLLPSERTGEAVIYSLTADGEVVNTTARLSVGTEALLRVRSTSLTDGSRAVLLESRMSGGGFVTDILSYRDGKLINLTLDEDTGVSLGTVRNTELYCRDIDGDGVLDVPCPVPVPTVSENVYYRIAWHAYSAAGKPRLVANTFNNYNDGWYLLLPDAWVDRIAIRRSDEVAGERSIVFSRVDDEGNIGEDFLIVYALTGNNRVERSTYAGRFVLRAEEETIFSAIIRGTEEPNFPLSEALIRENFRIYYTEWITGET